MFGFLKKIFDDKKIANDIELPLHYVPLAAYPDMTGCSALEKSLKAIKKKASKELWGNSIKPKGKGQPIVYFPYDGRINFDDFFNKTGENMKNSEDVKINGGDLFQFVAIENNPRCEDNHYCKLSRGGDVFLDLNNGAYWTTKTLRHDLIEQIKTWLLRGQLIKIPEGNSVRITQETIEDTEDEDPMARIQTLIESLEDLGHKIKESYDDHSLAIKQCEADLQYIKDITDNS